jgi:hypothetical protein
MTPGILTATILVLYVYVSHTFATDMLIRLWIFVTNIFFLVHSVELQAKNYNDC